MSKKVLRSNTGNAMKKQGSISSFVVKQTASDLLRSKDGLKQGRIESFMQKKRKIVASDDGDHSSLISKKRVHGDDQSVNKVFSDTTMHKKPCRSPLTNNLGSKIEPIEKIVDLTDNEMPNPDVEFKENVENCEPKNDNNLLLNCGVTENNAKSDELKNDNETSNQSFDEMGLNDSFFDAALDGMSPMKARDDTVKKELSCSIQCSSTKFALAKYRFNVIDVEESNDEHGFPSKTLSLKNESSKADITCELKMGWANTKISKDDIINMIIDDGYEANNHKIIIDSQSNLIVTHPDLLISGTTVSNAIGCKRRAILSERFKNTESGDCEKPVMLIGTIVHTLFQTISQSNDKITSEQIVKMAENIIGKTNFLKDLLSVGTTQKQVLDGVKEFIPSLLTWKGDFIRNNPTMGIGRVDMNLPPGYENTEIGLNGKGGIKFSANLALTEVKDIEENVWSPLYGLKGKIDLTGGFLVRRQTHDKKSNCMKITLPLELKTGRESHSTEHHAQVAIYSMFCELRRKISRDDYTIPAGLLLYLKTGNLSSIALKRNDKRELIIIRNEIANYMVRTISETNSNSTIFYDPLSFPPTIDDERLCRNCSQLRNCSLVYKAIDKKQSSFFPSSSIIKLMEAESSHLSEKDVDYFNHWMTCTLLETRKSMRKQTNQYYWLRTPQERQEIYHCVTDLVLAGHGISNEDGITSLQTFKKSSKLNTAFNFNIFEKDEMVVISGSEHEFLAMASGIVTNVTENFITVMTDRKFEGYPKDMTYTIDKHEWPSINSFKASFHNLSVLMKSSLSANNLRELIINHREPTFTTDLQKVIPRTSKNDVAKMLRGLNRTQRQAIKRVLLSNEYTLVVGMPGSGKTTTIVAMVRILLLCGCRILLTSYTHSAIDTLLIKLIKYKVKFLRLGRKSQIHSSIHPFSEEELSKNMKTPEQLDTLYSESKIVACTCLAVTSHVMFTSPGSRQSTRSSFDVCIVDEASQISQPACLAPLLHADRFVLVGDHRQLPPLVQSRKAKFIGADESLFRRLSHHKSSLCELTLQYRMNNIIMQVSNYVTYEGRLECALESVASARLQLSHWNEVSNKVKLYENKIMPMYDYQIPVSQWLLHALHPEKPVLFLDTSNLQNFEEEIENGICNKTEAEIVKIIVDHLLQAGCKPNDIGIIAPFRKQLKTLEDSLMNVVSKQPDKIEISTVDKYQGRDKNVIIVSFVRCRKGDLGEKKGELLSDWRRLNVALTRSKHKLILIGCQKTLSQYEPCLKLLNYVNDNKMLLSI
ncbi:DNA replication ATP-dependent helicase/nuclease DNA2-like [Styela clava]